MESTWKGIGGRDAGKGVKGLGRPLYAGPCNGDGAREVWRRSRQTRMPGVLSLWLLSLCTGKEKVTRQEGESIVPVRIEISLDSDGGKIEPYPSQRESDNLFNNKTEKHKIIRAI